MRLRDGLLALLLLLGGAPGMARADAAAMATQPDAQAVRAAASAVEHDPLLPGMETYRILRFGKPEAKDDRKPKEPDLRWWGELVESFSGGLRVAIWLIAAGLLIWVLLRTRDWLLQREAVHAPQHVAPTHVGQLDIRPESLPPDVGAAARELWLRGELRAALSLLYRGALSRLVHGHGVAIRAASTEGECLQLATPRLAADAAGFLRQLVGGWQAVAYAQRELPAETMERLCAEFDRHLPAAGAAA